MRARQYHDVVTFRDHVLPLLVQHEAHSCVIFGAIARFTDPVLRRPGEPLPFMSAVEAEDGRAVLAATITGPYPIVVTPSSAEAAAVLVGHLADMGISVPGVISEVQSSEAFAVAWARRTGCTCRPDERLGLYQAEQVVPPRPVGGTLRDATVDDVETLVPFSEGFYREINEPSEDAKDRLRRAIREKRLFVWCNETGRVVSMAAWAGPTPNGIRVNFVYTPPELRGRGYASNCVAALTQRLLDSGRQFVFLFTDLAYAVSNRIYQSIGYRRVGEQQRILFDPLSPRR